MQNLSDITAIARSVAWGAVDILRAYYRGETLAVEQKKEGPVTAADIAVNRYILDRFKAELGDRDFGYLSEETYKGSQAVIEKPGVWIIDPLDGTRDFIEKTGEYAIHLALIENHRPILSVVALPESDKVYWALRGKGTWVSTRTGQTDPVQVSSKTAIADLGLVASRTHRDNRLDAILAKLPTKDTQFVGSVGCKIVTIVEQHADIYISLSGKSAPKDWDMAAPELILTEAGGKMTHADGSPLQYNTGDVSQWGCIVASNGHCHAEICQRAIATLAEFE
ncbi:3'(2'),5'-bisphosphate nucleotidase CysQ [Desertifilum sp. FACHB-1129]|uniref:inositol-phosphate phosphatase n=1 Tax=Desertifilum tharense IPPAS B-1220 TaxID=1781255 RepID=A0A1E5QJX9_9CYAN|nr:MULTISPECIES: 3'(2'),5'-bisphosphate nucleotidase CysQ [Desertifilum]MDA0210931.1 3'(2'),5'-bisphosphate nucleotidase CysQ [Cyanobacteria bacterium FC1]MBD2313466.1 3'(2'),5'-bisphosphate nucleotidase CysQ [Desertifilum sp. FACHB-1129]MBD2322336.1 3'(2'),5'-bisphosphate nucleotidase CysQ [Desertifilum sp. FACHB-866]MBD2332498.1 3'(2'),5'-bisphosphate nucleotidase CysQ [Desertifilum sp. FACHB-868]OEJ74901.1 3'(2'),5'-bisphosphate nucleotidase CysQ [Desertifilum tharense IPPAS B-1220]